MSSITGWLRLEPIPRTTDLEIALEARIADPLWLLARQWQIGEFAGQDAGSPIVAGLEAQVGRLSRFHPGAATEEDSSPGSIDYGDQSTPLEVLVEREEVRSPGSNLALAAEAGLHFSRLLDVHGVGALRDAYLSHYAIVAPVTDQYDPDGNARASLYAGRVIDGSRLRQDLADHRGMGAELHSLPSDPAVPNSSELLAAANAWMSWWEGFVHEPADAASSWKPNRLEYGFAVSAELDLPDFGSTSGSVTLHADEYREGDLDWFAFRAATGPDLGSPAEPVPPRTVTRTVIPTPVTYSGQPSSRFWGFEDAKVSFGELSSSAGDVGRFLLAEFALLYGDDWFVIPIDMEVGSLGVIDSLTVTDTFGITTDIPRSAEVNRRWNMFGLVGGQDHVASSADGAFFLPPTLVSPIVGDPVEEVAFFRDEMANMVWGVERKILSENGTTIDRYAEQQQLGGTLGRQQIVGDVQDAEVIYRLASEVPRQWIPFVPVSIEEASSSTSAIRLEQRSMLRFGPGGVQETVQPQGEVLGVEPPLVLEEEEVSRTGALVDRSFQMVRWTDGSRHLWLGRRVRQGGGEGASGLRFDFTEPA